MTPEVAVFDLGKVLVDFDYNIACRKIATRCKLELENIQRFMTNTPLLLAYECGELSNAEFFKRVCEGTSFAGTFQEFDSHFSDIFTPIPEMIELHARIRARGIPTWIFSNTNDLAVSHIRRAFPFFGNFDGYVYSYEHRAMKPDPKFYAVVERMTSCRGKQILYIDDRPENAATGLARGWQVIQHETPARTIASVRALGLCD